MSDERKRQLMQEALDGLLSPEEQHELLLHMETNPDAAEHYSRLKQVDRMLATAPFERAPQRLALTIMARLAQTVKEQTQLDDSMPQLSEAAIQVAMQMVTVATLPLMVGASWLMLNAMTDPELIEMVLQQVAALMLLVIDVMRIIIDEALAVFEEDPEAAMALLTLIPITLLTLVKQILGADDDEDDDTSNSGHHNGGLG